MQLDVLLERCRQGDELAWEALVRAYQGRVYGLAVHYLGPGEEARDVSQEIFIRVFQHLDRVQGPEHFLPWLVRIGRNACIDQLRRRKVRPPAQDVDIESTGHLASPAPTPEEAWTQRSRREFVRMALKTLSERSREILFLKDIQGLSIEEIASQLELPAGTVKSRCHRARLELAKKLRHMSGGRYGFEGNG